MAVVVFLMTNGVVFGEIRTDLRRECVMCVVVMCVVGVFVVFTLDIDGEAGDRVRLCLVLLLFIDGVVCANLLLLFR